jgi:hypothetical protein
MTSLVINYISNRSNRDTKREEENCHLYSKAIFQARDNHTYSALRTKGRRPIIANANSDILYNNNNISRANLNKMSSTPYAIYNSKSNESYTNMLEPR